MGRDDRRAAARRVSTEARRQPGLRLRVGPPRWFIEQPGARFVRQHRRDGHPLLLPNRKVARVPPGEVADVPRFEGRGNALGRPAAKVKRFGHLVPHGVLEQRERRVLRDEARPGGSALHREPGRGREPTSCIDRYRPRNAAQEARDGTKQRRLAAAVRADEGDDLALVEREGSISQRDEVSIPSGETIRLDHRVARNKVVRGPRAQLPAHGRGPELVDSQWRWHEPQAPPQFDHGRDCRKFQRGLARRPLAHLPSGDLDDTPDPVQQAFEPVLHHQHRRAGRSGKRRERVDHRIGPGRIELRSRLIEEQEPWPKSERRRDRDPLPLAAGKRPEPPRTEVGDAEALQQIVEACRHLARWDRVLLHAEGYLVFDRVRNALRLGLLEHHPGDSGQLPRRRA